MYVLIGLFAKWFTSSIIIPRYMYQVLFCYTSLFKNFWPLPFKSYTCMPARSNKNMGMFWVNGTLQINVFFHAITFLVKNHFKSIFLQKHFLIFAYVAFQWLQLFVFLSNICKSRIVFSTFSKKLLVKSTMTYSLKTEMDL